jgi:hypothetical protein
MRIASAKPWPTQCWRRAKCQCVTALPATQVTKPKNLPRICPSGVPEWEPNGDYFAFTDGTLLGQIHKIRSDGTGKSVKLTDTRKQEQGYFVIGWRD